MRQAEWKRLVRPLLPPGRNWDFRGPLCYELPFRWVLFGTLGEGSGFDKGVYVWRVQMPLYVPSDVVDLSWSERVGGGASVFRVDDPSPLASAVLAAVSPVPDERSALRDIVKKGTTTENRVANEAAAYAQILLGDLHAAAGTLVRVASGVAQREWERAVVDRADAIGRLLREEGEAAAVLQLERWRDRTVAALGLHSEARVA